MENNRVVPAYGRMWSGERSTFDLRPMGSIMTNPEKIPAFLGEGGEEKYRAILESLHGNRANAISNARKASIAILTSHLMGAPGSFEEFMKLPKDHQEQLRTTFGYLNPDTGVAYFRVLKAAGNPFPEILQANEENIAALLKSGGIVTEYFENNPLDTEVCDRLKFESGPLPHMFSQGSMTILILLLAIYGQKRLFEFLDWLQSDKITHLSTLTAVKILEEWGNVKDYPISWAEGLYGDDTVAVRSRR